MAIEIVDLPIKNGGSFHSYVNVYQRVYPKSAGQSSNAMAWGLDMMDMTCSMLGVLQGFWAPK
jgi:hypothetical protein